MKFLGVRGCVSVQWAVCRAEVQFATIVVEDVACICDRPHRSDRTCRVVSRRKLWNPWSFLL